MDGNDAESETKVGSRPSSPLNLKITSVTCYANEIWNRSSKSLEIHESELKRFCNATKSCIPNSVSLLKPSVRKAVPTAHVAPTYYIVGVRHAVKSIENEAIINTGMVSKETVCNSVVTVDDGKNKRKNDNAQQLPFKRTDDKRGMLVQVPTDLKTEISKSSCDDLQSRREKNEQYFIDHLPKCYKRKSCYSFRSEGELVWVNIYGRPWWPARITVDEETGDCKRNKTKRKKNSKQAITSAMIEYHVATFGTPSLNAWVVAGHIRDFRGRKQFEISNAINFSYYNKQQIHLLCGSNTVSEVWEKVVKEVEETYKIQIEEQCKKDSPALSEQGENVNTPEIAIKRAWKPKWSNSVSRRSLRIKQNQDSA